MAGKLRQAGTPVAVFKSSLPINSRNATLAPNTKASVFSQINEVGSANLQNYLGQKNNTLTNFGGDHKYSILMMATVQIALVQQVIQILVKERNIIQAGDFC